MPRQTAAEPATHDAATLKGQGVDQGRVQHDDTRQDLDQDLEAVAPRQRTMLGTLREKAAKGILKVLHIDDRQPEVVDVLRPDEIKRCIQYSAWAKAAYETTTGKAHTALQRTDVAEKCVPVLPMLDSSGSPVLSILSGSSKLPRVGLLTTIFHGFMKSDSQALLGLVDDQKDGAELVVAFRGTEPKKRRDWLTDLWIDMDPVKDLVPEHTDEKLQVHSGFTTSLKDFLTPITDLFVGTKDITDSDRDHHKSARKKQQAKEELSPEEAKALQSWTTIKTLQDQVKQMAGDKKITKVVFCGHSLGGALATLAAYWCKNAKDAWPCDVECYTFGAPRVGNEAFSEKWNETVLDKNPERAYRVVHLKDLVPAIPFSTFPIPLPGDLLDKPYYHVGGAVLLCQPAIDPMVGTDGNPKQFPKLAAGSKEDAYQAQRRPRPISLDNKSSADHGMDEYIEALLDCLH